MKLKHALSALILGVTSGFLIFAILNSFEEMRGFPTFLFIALLVSLLFSAMYSKAVKKLKNLRFFIPFTLATFLVSVFTFTLYIGFALMHEQAAFLHVRKIENQEKCVPITEESLSKIPVLEKAVKNAERKGKAILKINQEDVKILGSYYGKCVVYNGNAYEVNVVVT